MRSSRSRRMSGLRLTTQTSRSGTGPGPRTSPVGWTCPPGRPGCGSSSARSARTRGRSCGHRPRRAPVHRVRHRRQERPARGPGTAAPPPGPLREKAWLRQGHRAAEPAAEGVRPQPALVRDRGPGLRAAGLDLRCDLALLAGGDAGQVSWRWCCRLTALLCRNEGVACPNTCAVMYAAVGRGDRQFKLVVHVRGTPNKRVSQGRGDPALSLRRADYRR
jgi:hypothetical protein